MAVVFHDSDGGKVNRFVGLELEISYYENSPELDSVIQRWGMEKTSDGSIRPKISGDYSKTMELRTSPARGKKFYQQMQELCKALKNAKAEANDSCGLHIHVDVRDLKQDQLAKIALFWSKMEGQIWPLVDKKRQNADWCRSNVTDNSFNAFVKAFSEKEMPLTEIAGHLNQLNYAGRYKAMNFTSIPRHGTIENRMHEGTVDYNTIVKWAEINCGIFEHALNTDKEVLKGIEAKAVPPAKLRIPMRMMRFLKGKTVKIDNSSVEFDE